MDPFLQLLFDDPSDLETQRVYADWLNDQDDPRGPYLKMQLELRSAAENRSVSSKFLATIRSLYPDQYLPWVNSLELAGVFCRNLCDLDLASQRFDVGMEHRDRFKTHTFVKFPPWNTDRLGHNLRWLTQPPIQYANPHTQQARASMEGWAQLIDDLKKQGNRFPEYLELLMVDVELQSMLPSKTDDYFLQPERARDLMTALNDKSLFLPFYADSQWSVVYGLRINQNDQRYIPVLAGHPDYIDPDEPNQSTSSQFTVVGSSLESFIYQMWIDNHVWYATVNSSTRRDLTEEESRYLAFQSTDED